MEECPFCKSANYLFTKERQNAVGFEWVVECECCYATGPPTTNEEDAIKAWEDREC